VAATAATVRGPAAIVVLTGDDVHEDLFTAGGKLQDMLARQGFATRVRMGTAVLRDAADADLIVLYTAMGLFPGPVQAALADAVGAGTGLIAVHSANVFPSSGGRLDPRYRQAFALIGSRFTGHGPQPQESRFEVAADQRHPVTRGLRPFRITHEHYRMELAPGTRVVAWRATPAGREPVVHLRTQGRGRVCYLQLGHDMRVWDDPALAGIVTRCGSWARRDRDRQAGQGAAAERGEPG
jgi:type 1 glutamine amidotransferase